MHLSAYNAMPILFLSIGFPIDEWNDSVPSASQVVRHHQVLSRKYCPAAMTVGISLHNFLLIPPFDLRDAMLGSKLPGNYRDYRGNYRGSRVLGPETSNGR